MRAKIVYTVELDEIPSEVERLKAKALKLLDSTSLAVTDTAIDKSVEKTLERFEEASANLVTIDLLLRDSCAILEGYLLSKISPESLGVLYEDPGKEFEDEGG